MPTTTTFTASITLANDDMQTPADVAYALDRLARLMRANGYGRVADAVEEMTA